jgi:site-specific DNA-methyltransferase (adenine-specific)
MELNRVINGDSLEELKGIDDETFDMTFADPPFNLDKKYATYADDKEESAYMDWCMEWIEHMVRVTKPSGSIFIHNIPKWLVQYHCRMSELAEFRHWIAWDAATSPMGNSLQPAHYGILYYVKNPKLCKVYELRMPHKRCRIKTCNILTKDYGGKKDSIHPFGPLVSDVWTDIHRCKHACNKDDHPCQLPIHLLERLILLCTDEGDSVMDCFLGSGTTAMAAKRLGRQYLGIELSEKYAAICTKKLAAVETLSKLDGNWVSCYLNRIHTARDCDIYDRKTKTFRTEWQSLYENWPDQPEGRIALNKKDLIFRDEILGQIKKICTPVGTKKERMDAGT